MFNFSAAILKPMSIFLFIPSYFFWFEWICEVFSSRGNGFCQCILTPPAVLITLQTPAHQYQRLQWLNENVQVNFLKYPSNSFDQNKSIYITSCSQGTTVAGNFMYKLCVVHSRCTYPVSTYGPNMTCDGYLLIELQTWSLRENGKVFKQEIDTVFRIHWTKIIGLV